MGNQGQRVLIVTGDLVLGGDVLGGDAHVDVVERVVQRGDHHVDHLRVAHPGAPAHSRCGVGGAAHAFRAAADGDFGVTEQDGLRRGQDRLQAGTAEPVQGQGRHVLADARIQRRDAGEVHVLRFGVDHVAEHDMPNLVTGYAGALQRLPRYLCTEFGRRHILQAAAEIPDGGARAADDHYFALHVFLLDPMIGSQC